MLSNKEAQILIIYCRSRKNHLIYPGIICANHDSSMESTKKSVGLNLIEPIFIGDKMLSMRQIKLIGI